MPKTIYMPYAVFNQEENFNRATGIEITWTPSAKRLDISGWYDHCVGIESTSMPLREFLDRLGITENDVKKAFKQKEVEDESD
jgi:hypothetical protein